MQTNVCLYVTYSGPVRGSGLDPVVLFSTYSIRGWEQCDFSSGSVGHVGLTWESGANLWSIKEQSDNKLASNPDPTGSNIQVKLCRPTQSLITRSLQQSGN